jgi:type VI protein secretion system component VasF
MAEVKDLEQLPETAPEQAQEDSKTPAVPLKERWRAMPRKRRRRIIRWTAILLVLAIIAAILLKLFGGRGSESQVVTDVVQYGSITSMVENTAA